MGSTSLQIAQSLRIESVRNARSAEMGNTFILLALITEIHIAKVKSYIKNCTLFLLNFNVY